MWTVSAALMPALLLSIYNFGFRSLILTLVSVVSCLAVEAISQKALGRKVTSGDGSAVLTGILMAFVIPPGVPYWLPIIGAVPAIFINKELMGGLGFNVWNPALVGRAFLTAAFPVYMTAAWLPTVDWSKAPLAIFVDKVDAVSTATPLYTLRHYGPEKLMASFGKLAAGLKGLFISMGISPDTVGDTFSLLINFFIGLRPGCIGETSAALLLLGGIFLMIRGIITWHIPVSCIATVAVLSWIFGGDTWFSGQPLVHVLSGGLVLGAFFMCTDYVTSPSVKAGQVVFGIGVGALTVVIRLKGGYPEGVCYAILLMNCLTPALNEWFMPKRFAPPKASPVAAK
jgi:Na+-translocating ferredoxin:NAD+ oxidoreductase subunit D